VLKSAVCSNGIVLRLKRKPMMIELSSLTYEFLCRYSCQLVFEFFEYIVYILSISERVMYFTFNRHNFIFLYCL